MQAHFTYKYFLAETANPLASGAGAVAAVPGLSADEARKKIYAPLKYLLSKRPRMKVRTRYGYTALHAAAELEDFYAVQLLLDHGASINVQRQLGETPVHTACKYKDSENNIKILKLLLDGNCDTPLRTEMGNTPYTAANDPLAGGKPGENDEIRRFIAKETPMMAQCIACTITYNFGYTV